MTKIKKPTPERLREYRLSPLPFIEDMVILEDGNLIKLQEWQREVIKKAFVRDKNGRLKFNIILLSVPKKNGKTTMMSACLLWALFAHTPNAEVYCLSGDKDQARIAFDKVAKMIMRNPLLRDSCKVMKNEIYVPESDSIFRVLSTDAPGNHGNLASFVGIDELWQFEGSKEKAGRDLWYAMTHSPTRESVTMITTYAGSDTNSLLYELYDRGMKKEDPRQYTFWSEENLASWIDLEYLEQQRMRLPASVYQRLHENKWVGGENSFFTREDIMQCRDEFLKPKIKGEEGNQYFYGCDLGLVKDRTVSIILHQDKEGMVYVDSISMWSGSRNDPVKIADIEEDMLWATQNFPKLKIIVDPWNLKGTIERLKQHCRIEEFTFTSSNVEKLSRNLYYFIHNGFVKFFPCKELERELLSLNLEQRSYGYRFDHPSSQFSDHAMALSMALIQVATTKKPTVGVLFSSDQTFENFQEQQMRKEKFISTAKKPRVEEKHEPSSSKQDFLTLRDLEEWRKKMII
jgi:phage terminase large subunit-like protein